MDEQTAVILSGRSRQRSPNYPAIGLRSALERVGRLYAADKKAGAPLDAAYRHMGFAGRNGKSAVVLSALKKFGLIEDVNGRVAPTQRAVEILVLSKDDPRRLKAIKEAALSPDIYRDLYERYREVGIPSEETLKSELIAYSQFNPNAVDDFVQSFMETLDFASITTGHEVGSEAVGDAMFQDAAILTKQKTFIASDGMLQAPTTNARSFNFKTYTFPLSDSLEAELKVPVGLSADHLILLREFVEFTIRALGRPSLSEQPKAESQDGSPE